MSNFIHPPLLWGLLAVGIPIVIHLITVVRRNRVQWAAMEFLLESQRRHRSWILLKELLLLLLRMAAIALLVLMFAEPIVKSAWQGLWGEEPLHHVILLDDSFSMTAETETGTAFEAARRVLRQIVQDARENEGLQWWSVIPFSEAEQLASGEEPRFARMPLDGSWQIRLEEVLESLSATELAVGPVPALRLARQWHENSPSERRAVYLLSDFRTREWENPEESRGLLDQMDTDTTRLYLVQCAESKLPNLAVTRLQPVSGLRVSGVPLFMEAAVRNFGELPATNITLRLSEDGQPAIAAQFDEIPPGEEVVRRFQVNLNEPGGHRLQAELPHDALPLDNRRYAVVEAEAESRALILASDLAAIDSQFLELVFAPGGNVRTGITARVAPLDSLRNTARIAAEVIYLIDPRPLEEAELAALEAFVSAGGGLVIFLGERTQPDWTTAALYANGDGLFPLPLERPTELLVDRLEQVPDVEPEDHPLFQSFAATQGTLWQDVRVERYFPTEAGWQPASEQGTRVVARLRNGAPFIVEKTYGAGRVATMLSTLGPDWHNWPRANPGFVVFMLELHAYLASANEAPRELQVGQPLTIPLDAIDHEPRVRFVTPETDALTGITIEAETADESLPATLPDTFRSGFYQALRFQKDGTQAPESWAANVLPAEGDPRLLSTADLASRLSGIEVEILRASQSQSLKRDIAGTNLKLTLLIVVLALLLGEQLLSYAASYHVSRKEVLAPA